MPDLSICSETRQSVSCTFAFILPAFERQQYMMHLDQVGNLSEHNEENQMKTCKSLILLPLEPWPTFLALLKRMTLIMMILITCVHSD